MICILKKKLWMRLEGLALHGDGCVFLLMQGIFRLLLNNV